jgi:ABC-type transport system substrate-binding protein
MKNSGGATVDDFLWTTANSYNDDGYLATKYTSTGKDRVTPTEIPNITASVNRIRAERDPKRRTEMIKQIQKDLAEEMPDLPIVSTQPVLGYRLRWPWFRNDVYSVPGFSLDASTARPYTEYWYDATKKS